MAVPFYNYVQYNINQNPILIIQALHYVVLEGVLGPQVGLRVHCYRRLYKTLLIYIRLKNERLRG